MDQPHLDFLGQVPSVDYSLDITIAPSNLSFDNMTTYNWNNTWIFGPAEDLIILPVLLSLIALCAIFGNLLVIMVILGMRRMRTGPNLMLLNIAISDLVFIGICVPTSIINHITSGTEGFLSSEYCKFVHYVVFVTTYVGIYTLLVTCVFRFCSEYMPTKFVTLLSKTNAFLSCFVVWAAFLVSNLNFMLQKDTAIFQESFICIHNDLMIDQMKMKTLWITFLACAFLLPIIAICTLAICILHHPHKFLQTDEAYDNAQNEYRDKRQMTVTIMACMVVRAFCWLPIQIFIMVDIFGIIDYYSNVLYRKAEMISVCFALASACVNPIMYSIVSMDFKNAFKECPFLCKEKEEKVEDDESDMNETIMSIISDSSNHINYLPEQVYA